MESELQVKLSQTCDEPKEKSVAQSLSKEGVALVQR